MKKKNKAYDSLFVFRFAMFLLVVTSFSLSMLSGLYARYTATSEGGDSATVATFSVTEEHTDLSYDLLLEMSPGTSELRKIRVENNSEVAIAYIVTVRNTTKNVPYCFRLNDSVPELYGCTVTHYLAPGEAKELTLAVTWDKTGALAYIGMVDLIKIEFTAVQVD